MRSANSACTTSTASSRLLRTRSALRTSAGPYARYAACGSLAASTLNADLHARSVVERIRDIGAAERTVGVARAHAAVVALHALLAVAYAARAVLILAARRAARQVLIRAADPR